ncbi:hypothetical protein LJ656_10600 [Paraburkholderia sp. MMS20-SJTR3]|uniref:Uncharacterized protein n=1 Tax=Paraburkholderia sejongensis TaxID=2886946 RepID=A0ABS8JTI4_9BURK|nr:hypothetical protein [Paraburkholderia sp. MMS20-SJTR3]MCC8393039.1 hypothetical protein [Paraburkholderia sp. MMS20-SJTR3]
MANRRFIEPRINSCAFPHIKNKTGKANDRNPTDSANKNIETRAHIAALRKLMAMRVKKPSCGVRWPTLAGRIERARRPRRAKNSDGSSRERNAAQCSAKCCGPTTSTAHNQHCYFRSASTIGGRTHRHGTGACPASRPDARSRLIARGRGYTSV